MAPKSNPFATAIFRKEEVKNAKMWFRDKINNLSASDLSINMSDIRYRGNLPLEGRMIYYAYKAKYDGKLPYWDKFPLVIVIGETNKYIQGLNLHYLPPKLRIVFMKALMDTVNNDHMNKSTKFKATYQILQEATKFRYFKPCIKLYLKNQIRSKIMIIRPEQWPVAINLPVANFKGASLIQVWNDSKIKYQK